MPWSQKMFAHISCSKLINDKIIGKMIVYCFSSTWPQSFVFQLPNWVVNKAKLNESYIFHCADVLRNFRNMNTILLPMHHMIWRICYIQVLYVLLRDKGVLISLTNIGPWGQRCNNVQSITCAGFFRITVVFNRVTCKPRFCGMHNSYVKYIYHMPTLAFLFASLPHIHPKKQKQYPQNNQKHPPNKSNEARLRNMCCKH